MATACCCSDGVDGYEWDWFESVPMYVDVPGGCGGSRLFLRRVESGKWWRFVFSTVAARWQDLLNSFPSLVSGPDLN